MEPKCFGVSYCVGHKPFCSATVTNLMLNFCMKQIKILFFGTVQFTKKGCSYKQVGLRLCNSHKSGFLATRPICCIMVFIKDMSSSKVMFIANSSSCTNNEVSIL